MTQRTDRELFLLNIENKFPIEKIQAWWTNIKYKLNPCEWCSGCIYCVDIDGVGDAPPYYEKMFEKQHRMNLAISGY
jgi:hypothetical protein